MIDRSSHKHLSAMDCNTGIARTARAVQGMCEEEKLQTGIAIKDEANELFRASQYDRAMDTYLQVHNLKRKCHLFCFAWCAQLFLRCTLRRAGSGVFGICSRLPARGRGDRQVAGACAMQPGCLCVEEASVEESSAAIRGGAQASTRMCQGLDAMWRRLSRRR